MKFECIKTELWEDKYVYRIKLCTDDHETIMEYPKYLAPFLGVSEQELYDELNRCGAFMKLIEKQYLWFKSEEEAQKFIDEYIVPKYIMCELL